MSGAGRGHPRVVSAVLVSVLSFFWCPFPCLLSFFFLKEFLFFPVNDSRSGGGQGKKEREKARMEAEAVRYAAAVCMYVSVLLSVCACVCACVCVYKKKKTQRVSRRRRRTRRRRAEREYLFHLPLDRLLRYPAPQAGRLPRKAPVNQTTYPPPPGGTEWGNQESQLDYMADAGGKWNGTTSDGMIMMDNGPSG